MNFDADAVSRRVVATYASYAEAERAVDLLADEGFPVERLSIVGSDLRTVEQVTGRLSFASAAAAGAAAGAWTGSLFGLIFALFLTDDAGVSALGVLLYGLVFGALMGALFGVGAYALTAGRRDFASVSGLQAGRYDVMADVEVADEVASRLAGAVEATPDRQRSSTS
ncbi:MAG TPA: general stress protein [Acidimicrobiales bacterium]|nr:general stress protein [Acidimicrobiales bacterium]HWI05042.1 general stress protein [Acidimicrobiales bacterium]